MDPTCPCGSGAAYAECCGPLHAGTATAATAEALMRSRYSAYAVGDPAYLIASWDPRTRPKSLELDDAIEWRRLQIKGVSGGDEDDGQGTVQFVAHYWNPTAREYGRLEETSRFRRRGGRWLYVDDTA